MPNDNIATRYNKFQNDFGTNTKQDYDALIESLFAENFTKTINGEVYVKARSGLKVQLTELCLAVNGWFIEALNIQKSSDNDFNYISVWRVHTGDGKVYHAEATLGSVDGIKINSVNENAYLVGVNGSTEKDL